MARTARRRANDERAYRRRLARRRIRKYYNYNTACTIFTPKEISRLKDGSPVEYRCRCEWCMALGREIIRERWAREEIKQYYNSISV